MQHIPYQQEYNHFQPQTCPYRKNIQKKKKSHSKSPTKVMLQLDWCVRKWTWRFVGLCKPHEKASYIIAFKYVLFETRPCYYNLTKKKKVTFYSSDRI